MAAGGLIERRNAHKAMHAGFPLQQTKSVFAFDAQGDRFQTGFFAGSGIDDRGTEIFAFRPAKVHTHEHFRPVLRFRAARTGLDGHDGTERVVFAGEERLRLELADVLVNRIKFSADVFQHGFALRGVRFFVRHVEIGFDVADGAREFFVGGNIAFGVFTLLQNSLSFFLVLPEGGIAGLGFEGLQAFAVGGNVKDSSARGRCAFSIRQNESEDLRCGHSQLPSRFKI